MAQNPRELEKFRTPAYSLGQWAEHVYPTHSKTFVLRGRIISRVYTEDLLEADGYWGDSQPESGNWQYLIALDKAYCVNCENFQGETSDLTLEEFVRPFDPTVWEAEKRQLIAA